MDLSLDREAYKQALQDRSTEEMKHLEDWIDKTQDNFHDLLNSPQLSNRRRSSVIFTGECIGCVEQILQDYEHRGFKKKRVQEAMEDYKARKPFEGSVLGTVREKHNKFMNFIFTIFTKQKQRQDNEREEFERTESEKRELVEKEERERMLERKRREEELLENIQRERERREAELKHQAWRLATQQNSKVTEAIPMNVSNQQNNSLCDGKFIGSIYIGNKDSENWTDRFHNSKTSWRVRL